MWVIVPEFVVPVDTDLNSHAKREMAGQAVSIGGGF
jgi:hypothetical protein